MIILDTYERALLAISVCVGDTQSCSNAVTDSRQDFSPAA